MLSVSGSRPAAITQNTDISQPFRKDKCHPDNLTSKISEIGNSNKILQTYNRVNKYLVNKDTSSILSSLKDRVKEEFFQREPQIQRFIKDSLETYYPYLLEKDRLQVKPQKDWRQVNYENSIMAKKVLSCKPENLVFMPCGTRPTSVKVYAYEGGEFVGGFRADAKGKVVDSYDHMPAGCYPLAPSNDVIYTYVRNRLRGSQ